MYDDDDDDADDTMCNVSTLKEAHTIQLLYTWKMLILLSLKVHQFSYRKNHYSY